MANLLRSPFIIADVGSNWRRFSSETKNLECALNHITEAKKVGCSAVKFQLFSHKELFGVSGDETYSMPTHWLKTLKEYANSHEIEFMCTAFSEGGVELVDQFVSIHKVASCEMRHRGILDAIKRSGKPFIVSTGAQDAKDIMWVINEYQPDVILECVARYPALPEDYNLSAFENFRRWNSLRLPRKDLAVGVSDHTLGITVALTAVGLGATVFEKHFDVMKDRKKCFLSATPDTPHSSSISRLGIYVQQIQEGVKSMGNGVKRARSSEQPMIERYLRRIKAIQDIKAGDILLDGVNFGSFRSLTTDMKAAPSERIEDFIGKKVRRAIKKGDGISFSDIEEMPVTVSLGSGVSLEDFQ